ncbi:LADA_0C03158g1_1 [Lachancea dasiensis]|uniref:LADA_0C03158g1_1 n=1 Tax=Lachancea dasiensis TaxID=1072105 RepID=A0A1G4IY55_9SACH|nr:LADA_0C03158g1_1 [Lachancea dasiensis]
MNNVVDWLPYADEPVTSSNELRLKIEQLVQQELLNFDLNVLHPGVESLIGRTVPSRAATLYTRERKRSTDEPENVADSEKRSCSGIEKARYDLSNCKTPSQRAIAVSFLEHQESVLQELLPRSLARQWVTNNEYLGRLCGSIKQVTEVQTGQIDDLETLRRNMQSNARRELAYLEQQWKNKLVENVERALGKSGSE